MKKYIYIIKNDINEKVYIGQAKDVKQRFLSHCKPSAWTLNNDLVGKAIQKYGKETFVFIDAGDGKFVKRVVELGEKADNGYYAESGISKGDKIVTTGSFMLKSEMLKSEFAEED